MEIRHYYKVEPGSEADKFMAGLAATKRIRGKAITAAFKKLKLPAGTTLFGNRDAIYGVGTEPFNPTDPNWKWCKKHGCNMPTATPQGKAFKAILKAIPPDFDPVHATTQLFDTDLILGHEGRHTVMRYAGFSWYTKGKKHQAFIALHATVKTAAKHWPEGLVEITASELAELIKPFEKKPKKPKKGEEELI